MRTNKTATGTTIRTTTDNSVNPVDTDVVNKSETHSEGEAEKVIHSIKSTATQETSDKDGVTNETPEIVPAGTISEGGEKRTPLELLEEARNAASVIDTRANDEKDRRKDYGTTSKIEGRNVIKYMLRFIESFKDDGGEIDNASLTDFLDKHTAKSHGNTISPYHRISKYCSVSDSPKVLVSKRANVLGILVKKDIRSVELDEQFDRKEPVGPDKVLRSGMQKYLLLHEIENGTAKGPPDKYKNMKPDRLIQEMQSVLAALTYHHLLPDNLVIDLRKQLKMKAQEAA